MRHGCVSVSVDMAFLLLSVEVIVYEHSPIWCCTERFPLVKNVQISRETSKFIFYVEISQYNWVNFLFRSMTNMLQLCPPMYWAAHAGVFFPLVSLFKENWLQLMICYSCQFEMDQGWREQFKLVSSRRIRSSFRSRQLVFFIRVSEFFPAWLSAIFK